MPSSWRIIDLGSIPPLTTQAIYHAVALEVEAGNSPNTLILCRPGNPLVCIGYHQDLASSVDLEYCKVKGLPVVRRILGGGAVYLDSDQLFYQIIAKRTAPDVPRSTNELFRWALEPPVRTLNELGVAAVYRPINDIEVSGRKISGNGAGSVGDTHILTGNIIMQFNYDEMVRVLRVPSEKFRDKIAQSLRERLTTLHKEMENPPDINEVKDLLRVQFERILKKPVDMGEITAGERKLLKAIEKQYSSFSWLDRVHTSHSDLIEKQSVKITSRTSLGKATWKAQSGLIQVLVEVLDNQVRDIMITGDFTMIPHTALSDIEKALINSPINRNSLANRIQAIYERQNVETPGIEPEDIVNTIIKAASPTSYGATGDD